MLLPVKAAELRLQRKKVNITQYGLAIRAGLPVNAIYRLESGATKTTNHLRAREIAKALGCKVEDFCTTPERSA